jgi:hypothetical protein
VNQPHQVGCAVRNTTAAVVWFGPAMTPGMLPRLVVDGDVTAKYITCLHCENEFQPGEVIFENRAQVIGIHGHCILEMARAIPRDLTSPDEVEAEYEQRLTEIIQGP